MAFPIGVSRWIKPESERAYDLQDHARQLGICFLATSRTLSHMSTLLAVVVSLMFGGHAEAPLSTILIEFEDQCPIDRSEAEWRQGELLPLSF